MKTKTAWLTTWEWIGEHAAVESKIAAVTNYRKSGAYVRSLVEQLYIAKTSTAVEMAQYAKDPSANPYPAEFHRVRGVPWHGRIRCGHNPHLFARKVSNLRSVQHGDETRLEWDEIPMPKFPD
jgi:hypothetical protein